MYFPYRIVETIARHHQLRGHLFHSCEIRNPAVPQWRQGRKLNGENEARGERISRLLLPNGFGSFVING